MYSPRTVSSILKWYFNTTVKKKPFPLICNIWMTNICNFRCKFCYQDFSLTRKTLSLEKFKEAVDDLAEMGTIYLYISGGEPLLVENISERLSYGAERIPYVHMVTNGFLLDRDMALSLAKSGVNEVSVSIDGMEKTHTKYRSNEKAFAHAIRAINNLKEFAPRISISVSTMIAPWNIDDQMELMKLCDSMNVKQRLTAFEDFPVVKKNYINDFDITAEFINKLKVFLKYYSSIHKDRFLKFIEIFFESKINKDSSDDIPLFKNPCVVPSFYINILEDGTVFPCHGVNSNSEDIKTLFNINRCSLKEIISSKGYSEQINALKSCMKCRELLSSCYIRPRLAFPFSNLIKYTVYPRLKDIFKSFLF